VYPNQPFKIPWHGRRNSKLLDYQTFKKIKGYWIAMSVLIDNASWNFLNS